MPQPPPLPLWPGQPAYLIGGGKSLEHFDFAQLKNRNVIGINQAFLVHPDIVDITVFGDPPLWTRHCIDLAAWDGYVATNRDDLQGPLPPWLKVYQRIETGLGTGETLAFNYNSGALAINLAITLQANPIYLLGFDCHTTGHWHGRAFEKAEDSHYNRFRDGFAALADAIRSERPDVEVFNVSQGTTKLAVFPIVPFAAASLVAPLQKDSHANPSPALASG